MPGDKTTVAGPAASPAGYDNTVHDDGAGSMLSALHFCLPAQCAGTDIQSDNKVVRSGMDDRIFVDSQSLTAGGGFHGGVHLPFILPDQIAGGTVQGEDNPAGTEHVHNAVIHQRNGLHLAGSTNPPD